MNWDKEGNEAVERLRRMLRFNTTNPPGNESGVARNLAEEAESNGLPADVFEPVEGREIEFVGDQRRGRRGSK